MLMVGRNLSIEAAQNTQGGSDFNETKKSGLFGSGGIGFTIGKQQQSTDAQNTQTIAASSTVAAISGLAGNTAARTGDAETGIKPIFNQDDARREVNAQVAITQEFGKQFSKAEGKFADTQLAQANRKEREAEQAKVNGDNARAEQLQAEANAIKDNWGNSGQRHADRAAVGATTGGSAGTAAAFIEVTGALSPSTLDRNQYQ